MHSGALPANYWGGVTHACLYRRDETRAVCCQKIARPGVVNCPELRRIKRRNRQLTS